MRSTTLTAREIHARTIASCGCHLNEETRREALGWIEDADLFLPDHATDHNLRYIIERHYEGGWVQFVTDGEPVEVAR